MQENTSPQVQVITPGLVLIKGALSKDQQVSLCNFALKLGNDPKLGFWQTLKNGEKVLNSAKDRGRIYDAIHKFPEYEPIKKLCTDAVKLVQEKDSKMPSSDPTHLLLLYYAGEGGMYWHRDNDKNDGTNDKPVVSVSLGNSCDFGYKLIGRTEQYITLESGDIILFGGPQRMIEHCVKQVHRKTSPSFLPIEDVRINFTFREVPETLGKEGEWKYSVERDNENFEQLMEVLNENKPL